MSGTLMVVRKNWDKVVAELSSGDDSDEGDSLNILSVQRNAHRVAELLHGTMPGLDVDEMRNLPRGMNKVDFMREGLAAAVRARDGIAHPNAQDRVVSRPPAAAAVAKAPPHEQASPRTVQVKTQVEESGRVSVDAAVRHTNTA